MKAPLMLSVAVFDGALCELNDNSTTDELTRNEQLTCPYPERKNRRVAFQQDGNNNAVHNIKMATWLFLQSVENLKLGPPNTNSSSGTALQAHFFKKSPFGDR